MPSVYSKYLAPKLKDAIENALNQPHDKQVAVYEELAISRELAGQALKLAQPLFIEDPELQKKITPEARALMMDAARNAIDNVKNMVLAASKIEKDAKDNISLKAVHLMINQLILVVHEVCGDEHKDIAAQLADAIEEKLTLPLSSKDNQTVEVNLT